MLLKHISLTQTHTIIFFVYLALMLVLEVIETIATLSFSSRLEVSQEVIIGGVTTSHLLHRDELLILDEEDAVAVAEHKKIFH